MSNNVFMFIDETGTDNDSKILAVCCVITNDCVYLRQKLNELKDSILKDPHLKEIPSIKKSVSKKGFHYCEDCIEVKTKVIDLIMQLPFEAYICYQEKEDNFDQSSGYAWYDRLFGRLLFERLRANKTAIIKIFFEQHDNQIEKRQNELKNIINQLVEKIELEDRVKFLVNPQIQTASKEEPCLVLADYVVAIFKYHAANGIGKLESWQNRNFKKIKPKLRVIHNYTSDKFFTRKNPFPC